MTTIDNILNDHPKTVNAILDEIHRQYVCDYVEYGYDIAIRNYNERIDHIRRKVGETIC